MLLRPQDKSLPQERWKRPRPKSPRNPILIAWPTSFFYWVPYYDFRKCDRHLESRHFTASRGTHLAAGGAINAMNTGVAAFNSQGADRYHAHRPHTGKRGLHMVHRWGAQKL